MGGSVNKDEKNGREEITISGWGKIFSLKGLGIVQQVFMLLWFGLGLAPLLYLLEHHMDGLHEAHAALESQLERHHEQIARAMEIQARAATALESLAAQARPWPGR